MIFIKFSGPMCNVQGDQIGRFLKVLATNFRSKVAQMYGDFGGYFEKWPLLNKITNSSFYNIWETLGYFLFSHMVTLVMYSQVRKTETFSSCQIVLVTY